MGAWGIGNFENDDAMDWVAVVIASSNKNAVIEALTAIAGNSGYLDAPECCEALCAAEIIAAQKSGTPDSLPEELSHWLSRTHGPLNEMITFSESDRELALEALQRITAESELMELWEESDGYEEWCARQEQLANLLR